MLYIVLFVFPTSLVNKIVPYSPVFVKGFLERTILKVSCIHNSDSAQYMSVSNTAIPCDWQMGRAGV
jgi:hypothetical protein